MESRFLTHVADPVFISLGIGVTASENLFRLIVLRMTVFGGRAPKCCLFVFIDDATGHLMHLRFGETVSAFDYMMAIREYLEQHGKSLAFYSDKHDIFRGNNGGLTTTGVIQSCVLTKRPRYPLSRHVITAVSSNVIASLAT